MLEISQEDQKNAKVLTLKGNLGADEADSYKSTVKPIFHEQPNVVIDLGDISLMDSLGLASLIVSLKWSREREGDVKLANLTQNIQKLMDITRVSDVIDIYPSVEEALNSFED